MNNPLIDKFARLIWEKNKVMNLVGFKDFETFFTEGISDSIFTMELAARFFNGSGRILDIGTGAGIPGIIAAIFFSGSRVTLVESQRKKAEFCRTAVQELELPDCTVNQIRAEEFDGFECFDLAFCRAVSSLPVTLEYTIPFLKIGGVFIAHKGTKAEAELSGSLQALKLLKAELLEKAVQGTKEYLVFKKTGRCPKGYPRRTGIPEAKPLS
ncbi:MAG: 16S rRNA (guanine(527)-N(7))-methyltransferase RsmG [Candidatus Wallbacteria bacterium]|nr:16S rRNA (guanine(527)-N(7))-methyltransferase RsmG [Candidatus Wallbacteria bacterium]